MSRSLKRRIAGSQHSYFSDSTCSHLAFPVFQVLAEIGISVVSCNARTLTPLSNGLEIK